MHLYAVLVALSMPFANALLDHPALWPTLDKFTQPLADGLPAKPQIIDAWPAGTISSLCRDRIIADKLDPTTFQGYSIYVDDVGSPCVSVCDIEQYLCGNMHLVRSSLVFLHPGERKAECRRICTHLEPGPSTDA
jgi:hypothetical protein